MTRREYYGRWKIAGLNIMSGRQDRRGGGKIGRYLTPRSSWGMIDISQCLGYCLDLFLASLLCDW